MNPILESDLILHPDGSVYHLGLKPEQICDAIIGVGDPERVESVSRYFDRIDFKQHKREFISHRGSYKGKEILVISTGIGADNVEIVLTELDALVNIDWRTRLERKIKRPLKIVRVGTSGALQPEIKIGSEVVSIWGIGLDNLMNFYKRNPSSTEAEISLAIKTFSGINFTPYVTKCSPSLLAKVGYDMISGNTVTCPGFYAPQGRKIRLDLAFPNLLNDLTKFRSQHLALAPEGEFALTNFEMETAAYYAFGNLLNHEILSVNAILVNRATNECAPNADSIVDGLIRKVLERI